MIELLQITNDPSLAARCEALPGMRIFLDLERNGKAQRQAGRNTFISAHQMADIAPVKAVLKRCKLMVRVNPLHAATKTEVDQAIVQGADMLMLPMFRTASELAQFCALVAGRVPVSALLETAAALDSLAQWVATPGLNEVYVGLNDLHIDLGLRFMFEPLALGHVERVARAAQAQGLRFGFGGMARLEQGLLPGRAVLAEHLRLGSQAVILSRTFREADGSDELETQIALLRQAEQVLAQRSPAQIEVDRLETLASIANIAINLRANA